MLSGVIDANMVVGLAKGGVFDLLKLLYTSLYTPSAVVEEVIAHGQGRTGGPELTAALGHWITEVTPTSQEMASLTPTLRSVADHQVLVVAKAHGVDHILTNDVRLIRAAQRHRLSCLETPVLLVLFKRRGLIAAIRPILDRMVQEGFGIAPLAYQQALQAAGE